MGAMERASTFHILPAIDLRGGRVVRLRQGDFDRETAYEEDPVAVAQAFADAGARWLHVVDLDGARTGARNHEDVIARIVATVGERVRVEVAGGLRDEDAVGSALASGAARAIVGTAAIREPAFAGRLVANHGPNAIAVAIDVRDGMALGHGWADSQTGIAAIDAIERLHDVGVTDFEVTAIDRDGLLDGPDLDLYRQLVALRRGSIIASGGIATLDDIRGVRDLGCTGVIIGRALYEGRLDLRSSLSVTEGRA